MNTGTRNAVLTGLVVATLVGTIALGASVTLPFAFTAGTTAKASEVNANFAAVKSAVDDTQTQVIALKNRLNDIRVFRPNVVFTFPGTGQNAQQTTVVDVPIFTSSSDGVLEFQMDISDVSAGYGSGNPELTLTLASLINGAPGSPVNVLFDPVGRVMFAPPIGGHIAFNVPAGAVVAVRISLTTFPACSSGRGSAPTCALSIYATARFTPNATLQ